MLTFDEGKFRFNYRVAGVCIHDGKVLLHKVVTDDFWALPGGRGEFMEYSQETLKREMMEELGVEANIHRLLWVAENFHESSGKSVHELSFYYLFSFPENHPYYESSEFKGIEPHVPLVYKWFPIRGLHNTRLFPTFLRAALKDLPCQPVHILHQDHDD